MKTFPNSFLQEAANRIQEGCTVKVCVSGKSMLPFLVGSQDTIFIAPCDCVKVGDIVFFYYNNRYIVHRVIKIKPHSIHIRGDGNSGKPEVIPPSQILGKVVKVQKENGKEYYPYTPVRKMLAAIWRKLFFVRRYLLYIYRLVR